MKPLYICLHTLLFLGARSHWRAHAVLLRIGLSYDLCGRALAEQVERALPPGAAMQSTVAGLHVALSREAAQLRDALERAGGPYARAFSARRDLMLRKRLAAVCAYYRSGALPLCRTK